jgi:O-antigen ligase/capsular polysaccharide biosynthesis protein
MNFIFSSPSLDDLIRLLKAWRFWVLGALLGALIGAAVYYIVPPPYRAKATVNVDFNLEEAWPKETDRQQFYYLEREARKLEELAWSDEVMEKVSSSSSLSVEELRNGKLQLSQPAEAGWHFYADDRDPKVASQLASDWANEFTKKAQSQIDAGNINQYVKLEVTQSKNPPKERSIPLSSYLLAGSFSFLTLAVFAVLFIKSKTKTDSNVRRRWSNSFMNTKQQSKNQSLDAKRLDSLKNLSRILWAAALITLPVTSFRWFPFLGESTLVRPLSLYPLAILLPLLLIQAFRKKINLYWAGAFISLGAFVLFTVTATSLGLVNEPLPLRGLTYFGRAIRALVTLFIGLAFFICAVWMNKDEDDFRFTLRWLFAGFLLDVAWSGLQAVTFYTHLLNKEMVTHWQLAFSMRELVRTNRISGLAFEPAWLAGQFATTYIPFLFAAVLTNFRLTRAKWLEPVLLAISLLVVLATYSRGGLLSSLAAAGLTFLFLGRDVMRAMWTWFISGFRSRTLDLLLRLGMIAAVLVVLVGAFLFLSRKEFIRNMWQTNASSLTEYLVDINAGARSAYSAGAMSAFEENPVSGVGLGASGFYIYQNLPDWALTFVPEIAKQLDPGNKLYPNPKNLYVRLLAETGLIGFFLFIAFQFNVLGEILSLLKRNENWARFAATAGVFAWLAVTFYNFTQDSLTTPNIWVIAGILVGLAAPRSTGDFEG